MFPTAKNDLLQRISVLTSNLLRLKIRRDIVAFLRRKMSAGPMAERNKVIDAAVLLDQWRHQEGYYVTHSEAL